MLHEPQVDPPQTTENRATAATQQLAAAQTAVCLLELGVERIVLVVDAPVSQHSKQEIICHHCKSRRSRMLGWVGTINKKFCSHHCMGQTLQLLLKPRMVFISSAVSSKSNTCVETNISQVQQLTCRTHANNSSATHLDVLLDTPRCD